MRDDVNSCDPGDYRMAYSSRLAVYSIQYTVVVYLVQYTKLSLIIVSSAILRVGVMQGPFFFNGFPCASLNPT